MSTEMDRMRERIANQVSIVGLGATQGDQGDINSPAYRLPAYTAQAASWIQHQDLWEGTDAIRKKKETYMPRGQAEAAKDYDRRIATTPFYNMFKRTIKGLTGLAFRKEPKLNAPDTSPLAQDWMDVDLAGTAAPVFIKNLFESGVKFGHVAILVDYPTVIQPTARVLSVAEERAQNLRPYWCMIEPWQILNWRTMPRNGKTILQQVTLWFKIQQPVGMFGTQEANEYRVYTIDGADVWCAVFIQDAGKSHKEMRLQTRVKIANQTEIPLAIAYLGDKEGFLQSQSPLYELGHTNLDHYRVQADHRHSLHKASIPILVFKNRDKTVSTEEIVNPDWGVDVTGDNGDVFYREHSGSALGQTRTEIQDIEQRGASQGLSMLHRDTRTAETATANKLDKGEQNSVLGTMVGATKDCINQALKFHANFRKVAPVDTEFNYDFETLLLDSGIISVLSNLEVAGQITLETLWTMLERGGVLPDGFDRVKELAELLKSGSRPQPGVPDPTDGADGEEDPAGKKPTDGGAGQ